MGGSNKVDAVSGAYMVMSPLWDMVDSLMGGTPAMRAAGVKYLPQHTNESDDNWKARKDRSVLLNVFRKTMNTLAAKPFSKPIKVGEKVPDEIKDLLEDVDQLGHDLTSFSRESFAAALRKGFTHILVEYTKVDKTKVITKADEEEIGARPYLVHIDAKQVIAAYSTIEKGVEKLTHVRIREESVEREGYDEVKVRRIRVLEPGNFVIWESRANEEYKKVDEGQTGLDFIPFFTFYTQREGFMLSNPPLMDLAYKNIEHWQASSDQRNVLTVARFPILAGSGVKDEKNIIIGPRRMLASDDVQTKFYYVEHSGAAISAGKADLDDLKDEMAMLGIELMVRKGGGSTTATESSNNTNSSHSELQAMAINFADALKTILGYMAKWLEVEVDEDDLTVEVHTDFSITSGDIKDIEALKFARTTKEISHEAFIGEMKRRGVLTADFDIEKDQELLDAEPPPALPSFGAFGGPPGGPPKPGQKPPPPGAPPGEPDPKETKDKPAPFPPKKA